jgi:hypothetical protein
MSRDILPLCLAWQRLLDERSAPYHRAYDALIQAGHAHRGGRKVILQHPEALADLLGKHCPQAFQVQQEAEKAIARLGLNVGIDSRAEECLALLKALEDRQEWSDPGSQQQVSAAVFGDSKHLGKTSILKRIWAAWLKTRPARGDLRLKAFSALIHTSTGLDLSIITEAFGSVLLEPSAARHPEGFSLAGIDRVVTCENLAPFKQLSLEHGLLIYSQGYASRSLGGWLAALPDSCTWQHFGDLDADGLSIFEDLMHKSGREGCFVPDPSVIQELLASSGSWQGKRGLHPERYGSRIVRDLARQAAGMGVEIEQETLLAACLRNHVPLSAIGLAGVELQSAKQPDQEG